MFIRVSSIVCLVAILAMSALSWTIDPYKVWPQHFFNYDSQLYGHLALHKHSAVQEPKPASIVIGNSIVDFGIDPTHPFFHKPAYNYGIGAISIGDVFARIVDANESHGISQVLLVLDIPSRDQINKYEPLNKWKVIFSIDTFIDSVKAVVNRDKPYVKHTPLGMREQTNESCLWASPKERFPGMHSDKDKIPSESNMRSYLTDVARIAAYARENKIRLSLLLPRYHQLWAGQFDELRVAQFKQRASEICQVNACSFVDASQMPVPDGIDDLDFSAKDPGSISAYYWDEHHFKKVLGDLMLNYVVRQTAGEQVERVQ